MPGADLTPARLEALLAAATPGPWFVVEDDRPGMEWNRHICWDEHGDHRVAFMASDAGTEANASLIALSPALAARVIELEAALRHLVTLITAAAIEEETSTHVAVSFADADAANILRAALRARTALEATND